MSDPLGLESYGYPKVDIMQDTVRISLGWFLPDLDPDEAAYYLDLYFSKDGSHETVIDNMDCHFDFWTPLKDYGHWNEWKQWIPALPELVQDKDLRERLTGVKA